MERAGFVKVPHLLLFFSQSRLKIRPAQHGGWKKISTELVCPLPTLECQLHRYTFCRAMTDNPDIGSRGIGALLSVNYASSFMRITLTLTVLLAEYFNSKRKTMMRDVVSNLSSSLSFPSR